jgi:hypothetical protein
MDLLDRSARQTLAALSDPVRMVRRGAWIRPGDEEVRARTQVNRTGENHAENA